MKFKVFDSKLKSFLSEEFYFLDCNGKLHYLNHKEIVSEWIFPVFSTEKNDKNGVELFDGDILKSPHYKTFIYSEIIKSGSDFKKRYLNMCIKGKSTFLGICDLTDVEKIGSKFENPELLNIGD